MSLDILTFKYTLVFEKKIVQSEDGYAFQKTDIGGQRTNIMETFPFGIINENW